MPPDDAFDLATCSHIYEDPEHAEEYASAKRILHESFDDYSATRATPTFTLPRTTQHHGAGGFHADESGS
jgi:hypothetical protein